MGNTITKINIFLSKDSVPIRDIHNNNYYSFLNGGRVYKIILYVGPTRYNKSFIIDGNEFIGYNSRGSNYMILSIPLSVYNIKSLKKNIKDFTLLEEGMVEIAGNSKYRYPLEKFDRINLKRSLLNIQSDSHFFRKYGSL